MALTRSFLRGLGLEDDKIGAIIEAHTETVDGLKQANKAEADKLRDDLDAVKADLKAKETENTNLQTKYDDLDKSYNAYKESQANKEAQMAKETAYKALLKAAGISEKRLDAIMKVTSLDDVKLNKDGSIHDAEKLTETIKEEWSDFISTTETKGANVQNPPSGGGTGMTKADIMKIKDAKERQQAIADHMDLFTN